MYANQPSVHVPYSRLLRRLSYRGLWIGVVAKGCQGVKRGRALYTKVQYTVIFDPDSVPGPAPVHCGSIERECG